MDVPANPLSVLSLIVAPAVLTNASSVLAMSTSNRLARAGDRARELARHLEEATDLTSPQAKRRLRELASTERRSLMLLAALRSIYVALGGFGSATLFALLGSILLSMDLGRIGAAIEAIAMGAGLVALGAIVHASVMLVRETRIVVDVLQGRKRLKDSLEKLGAVRPGTRMPVHAAFGKIGHHAHGKLAHDHLDHHLKQFGV